MQYTVDTHLSLTSGDIMYAVKSRGREVAKCSSLVIARRVARGLLLENIERDKKKNLLNCDFKTKKG